MTLRRLLVALVVAATAAVVVGVAIERGSTSDHHDTAAQGASAREATGGEAHRESGEAGRGGEGTHTQAEAGTSKTAETSSEELRPFGIDVEAWPFVALGAAASLALAAAAALRPQSVPLLVVVAVALAAFAALDIREVVHQLDEDKTGLAVLAGAVALLHLASAAVAGVMASRARTDHETVGPTGTMAA
jgi:hypothetical protein